MDSKRLTLLSIIAAGITIEVISIYLSVFALAGDPALIVAITASVLEMFLLILSWFYFIAHRR
jgi:hypothetical protein